MNNIVQKILLIDLKKLRELISLSRSSIYDRLDSKSTRYDPTFPKPLKLGRATRWKLDEIEAWIECQANARLKEKKVC